MHFFLQAESGQGSGKEFPLHMGENLVGRSRSAQVRVYDEDVSGKHFIIELSEDSARLRNLSHYGTRLDGILVHDSADLLPGQTLEAGKKLKFVFRKRADGEAEAETPQDFSEETSVTRFAAELPEDLPPSAKAEAETPQDFSEETSVTRFAAEAETPQDFSEETSVTRFAAEPSDASPASAGNGETDSSGEDGKTVMTEFPGNHAEKMESASETGDADRDGKPGTDRSSTDTLAKSKAPTGEDGTSPQEDDPSKTSDSVGAPGNPASDATRVTDWGGTQPDVFPARDKGGLESGEEQGTFFEEDDILEDAEKTSGNETQIIQTRMANVDEIKFIKDQIRKQRQSRLFLKILIFVVFAVLLGIIWVLKSPQQEKELSWPQRKGSGGRTVYMTGYLPAFGKGRKAGGFDVYYPEWEDQKRMAQVGTEGRDTTVIRSWLGKASDVPLRIILQKEESDSFVYEDRNTALKNMLGRLSEQKGELFNFDNNPGKLFLTSGGSSGNGVLCDVLPYQREQNKQAWFGILRFFRNGKYNYILRAEVPAEEKLRALPVLTADTFLVLSPSFEKSHWEGDSEYAKGNIDRRMPAIKDELFNRNSPMQYPQLELAIKSLLAQLAYERKDKQYDEAIGLLLNLRDRQQQWYIGQKIRWLSAIREKNASERRKIRNESEAVFSINGDKRRYDILRDYWE